jgi:hypothetical protein
MTIPSEFDLIAIERRADELDAIAIRLDGIANREYERATTTHALWKAEQTGRQADAVRGLASDVVLLLGLIRSMREGGRVSSVR